MKIAVVGGGINGVMSAWNLAEAGFEVEVFERDQLIGATSSASTKLLHGGLRYLEQFRFGLVAEGLRERAWWLENAPQHTRTLQLILPLYDDSFRSRFRFKTGLALYDWLAGNRSIGRHRWLPPSELARTAPQLKAGGLRGAFLFHDGQMNDRALGLWAADRARESGVDFHERSCVQKISAEGGIVVEREYRQFDFVVNAAGPWARSLLDASGIASRYQLDLVRGSHVVFAESLEFGFVLEAPADRRICFALPYENKTLLGTTEVRQSLSEPARRSAQETCYLLGAYNRYFRETKTERDIVASFAGLRPLVHGGDDATRQSRECALEMQGRLVTIYGGKWTSSRALGQKVTRSILERSRLLV